MHKIDNFIDGQRQAPVSGHYLDNVEPATGQVYSQVASSDADDVDRAVAAATAAAPGWYELGATGRAACMRRLAALVTAHADALAQAESKDNGKPLWLASEVDIPRVASNLEFFADAATQFASECHPMTHGINYTLREPLGVVGCISPWNLPLYLMTWKIAPALAAGNTVVAKPSEVTPATASLLAELTVEAGWPPGVLNLVHGSGPKAGASLVDHPGIKAVSFTGGTATGKAIASAMAPTFRKVSLELGGKNPTVVFDDCDFEQTVDQVARAAFSNQGQICLCGSRILVQQSIYERFKKALVERVAALRVGDPTESTSQQGALVSAAHRDKVLAAIDTARAEGGQVLCGGHPVEVSGRCSEGYFVAPTLIEGLDMYCATAQEEIFGPVATLHAFADETEAVQLANATRYGLAASVWSKDVHRCHRVAKNLQCGIVWVNCWMVRDLRTPFGGTKASGLGREGGLEAMRFFTEPKNVCIDVGL